MAYHDLEKTEENESLLRTASEQREGQQASIIRIRLQHAIILICLSLTFFLLGFVAASQTRQNIDTKRILGYTSRASPVTKNITIRWTEVQFNGSLLKEKIYRLDAGPEVDAAWKELGVDYHAVIIPPGLAPLVGLEPDQVQVSPKYGGGFPANIEGLHHLHCLNLIRQSLHWNYAYYSSLGHGAFKNEEFILKKHTTHCLDILRQQLMCTIDIGVMGQVWWKPGEEGAPRPIVDFNTKHVCRNFEDVRRWAEESQMPEKVPMDFLLPPRAGQEIPSEIP